LRLKEVSAGDGTLRQFERFGVEAEGAPLPENVRSLKGKSGEIDQTGMVRVLKWQRMYK
jgi:hypothetical protein